MNDTDIEESWRSWSNSALTRLCTVALLATLLGACEHRITLSEFLEMQRTQQHEVRGNPTTQPATDPQVLRLAVLKPLLDTRWRDRSPLDQNFPQPPSLFSCHIPLAN